MLSKKFIMGAATCALSLTQIGCDQDEPMTQPPAPAAEVEQAQPMAPPAVPQGNGLGDGTSETGTVRPPDAVTADETAMGANQPEEGAAMAAENSEGEATGDEPSTGDEPGAKAELQTAEGQSLAGEARFFAAAEGVKVVLDVQDATAGKKGVHIHEKGDCSDIPGKSMGGHFAPEGHEHALPSEAEDGVRHLGDLGNIQVGEDGTGHLELLVASANLKPNDPMSFLGKAVVVHSGSDSGQAKQPAGDSGTPMACGVIN